MSPKSLAYLILAVLIGVSLSVFGLRVYKWKQDSDKLQVVERIDKSTTRIISQVSKSVNDKQSAISVVSSARSSYDVAVSTDPQLQDRRNTAVPQRLLDLARERRIARERFGCVDARCED